MFLLSIGRLANGNFGVSCHERILITLVLAVFTHGFVDLYMGSYADLKRMGSHPFQM